MQKFARYSVLLPGLSMLLAGGLFAVFVFFITLQESVPIEASIGTAFLFSVIMSLSWWQVKRSWRSFSSFGDMKAEDVTGGGVFMLASDSIKAILGTGVTLTFLIAFSLLIFGDQPLSFGIDSLWYVAAFLLFFAVLQPLAGRAWAVSGLRSAVRSSSFIHYTLKPEGILFDLNIYNLGKDKTPWTIEILFRELTEVKVMNFLEARQYAGLVNGFDIAGWWRFMKEQPQYFSKKIPRFTKYFRIQGDPVLILRGPDLLYIVTVNGKATDVVEAFEKYQSNH